jgi:hypothetical protein
MASVPTNRSDGPHAPGPPNEPGWQACAGLTQSQAEELLDHLETSGVAARELTLEADGWTVRWRGPGLRLVSE